MFLGSSKHFPPNSTNCECYNIRGGSPVTDCNCLFLPYADGASFAGYRKAPWPVPGTNKTLMFRGLRNLDATCAERVSTPRIHIDACGRKIYIKCICTNTDFGNDLYAAMGAGLNMPSPTTA